MKKFITFILIIILCILVRNFPREESYDCYPALALMKTLNRHGLALGAKGVTEKYEAFQFWININTRNWVIIAIDTRLKDRACVVTTGIDWSLPGEVII